MEIEKQRWAPLPASCAPPLNGVQELPLHGRAGAFGWIELWAAGGYSTWEEYFDLGEKALVFDHETHWYGVPEAGCYLAKSCTEFASYARCFDFAFGHTGGEIVPKLESAFGGKGARVLDLDVGDGFPDASPEEDLSRLMSVVLVPNYGPAAKAWWWSGSAGATAGEVADVVNGKPWAAGNFKQDNKKKKLIAIERCKRDGKFRFVLNELKPGEAWWWGYGASIANITSVINGEAWADFKADGIEKRLVSLKRHRKENWTFLMVPRNGVGWWWYPKISFDDLLANAETHNARIIDLEEWGTKDDGGSMDFSAVLVQNA